MKEKLILGSLIAVMLSIGTGGIMWWDPVYHRTITGMVASEGSRWARSQPMAGDGGQKFAVLLRPFKAEHKAEADIAGGDGSAAVECLSTRCAVLQPGMCVELSCRIDHRLLEPSVVQCKMEKQLECGPAGFAGK